MSDSVLDRAGHLSELALDRYRYDPPAAPRDEVDQHLASCAECRAALLDLAHEDAAAAVPAPPGATTGARERGDDNVRPLVPRSKSSKVTWLAGVTGLLAAAALAFVVARPGGDASGDGSGAIGADDGDRLHVKSGPFDFEVFVHDGNDSRAVLSGDVVHPGERMGFRVRARELGYLLVTGRDDSGNQYMCYPGGDVTGAAAVPFPETPEPQVLPLAMRFDDILGSEHITATFCPGPFSASDLGGMDMRAAGCVTTGFTLLKRPREGGR
ncbi:MAG: hypothetical protein U1F43_13930 [Myxococcota bacterium]